MNTELLTIIAISAVSFLIVAVTLGVLLKSAYRQVPSGHALIINKPARMEVTFKGGLVLPIVHRAELMNITTQLVIVERKGQQGLICADKIRADLVGRFSFCVNQTHEDVLKVAASIGCERASAPDTLEQLFAAKCSEAMKIVAFQITFEELFKARDQFREAVMREVGQDLNGYILVDLVLDDLEQTPVSQLDPNNILNPGKIFE